MLQQLGGGKVYMETSEGEVESYRTAKEGHTDAEFKSEVGTDVDFVFTLANNYDGFYIKGVPDAGYRCVGIKNSADEFVGEFQYEGDYAGYYKIKVDPGEGRSGDNSYSTAHEKLTDGSLSEEDKAKWVPSAADYTFTAVFESTGIPAEKFYIYIPGQEPDNCGVMGTVTASSATVNVGESLVLTATAKPGNRFDGWTKRTADTGENTQLFDETINVTAAEETFYVANFSVDPLAFGADGIATYSNAKSVRVSDEDFANYKFYPAKIEDGKIKLLTTAGLNGVPDSNGDPHGAIVLGTPSTSVNLTWNSGMGEFGYYNAFSENDPKLKFDDDELKATAHGPITADGTQYVLGKKDGFVKFYRVKPGKEIPANKAYFVIPGGAKEFLDFSDDDETTAMANLIEMHMDENQGFNLQGQRVDNSYHGIIVKNGKKYINK